MLAYLELQPIYKQQFHSELKTGLEAFSISDLTHYLLKETQYNYRQFMDKGSNHRSTRQIILSSEGLTNDTLRIKK